ncbi:MAG: DNA mismatch endonuclease Vsr [Anaerolineales bacterium]|nr:DNA mismatch endonuclease Vsr [Anaerolineales bacterium]
MDNITQEQRLKNMRNVKSTLTKPERLVMRALRTQHTYFATYVSTLPGKPDIVFRRKRVVVFVDSDFWHGHPSRFRLPETNRDYWRAKIGGNRRRDRRVTRQLRQMGWKVLRVWEFDIEHNLDRVLRRITAALQDR